MDIELKKALEALGGDFKIAIDKQQKAMDALDERIKIAEEKTAGNEELGEFKSQLEESNKALEEIGDELKTIRLKQNTVEAASKDAAAIIAEQKGLADTLKHPGNGLEVKDITTSTFPNQTVNVATRTDNLGLVAPINRPLFLRDMLPTVNTNAPSWTYYKESGFTNNAAVVAEGNPKPQSEITFTPAQGNVKKLAHLFRVTEEALDDTDELEGYIRQRGIYGLRVKEEEQLLTGDGSATQLDGLTMTANHTTYDNSTVPGHTAVGGAYLDDIRIAIAQVAEADLMADVIVMNHLDAAKLQLDKDADGRWLHPAFTGNSAWGLPLVTTRGLAQGKFLLMGSQGNIMVRQRKGLELRRSTEDRDNFQTNRVTILIESRLGLEVIRPEGVVYGDFTPVTAAP